MEAINLDFIIANVCQKVGTDKVKESLGFLDELNEIIGNENILILTRVDDELNLLVCDSSSTDVQLEEGKFQPISLTNVLQKIKDL